MKKLTIKILLISGGLGLILLGLFLTFGILVYSLKEKDKNGFYGFFFSFGLIGIGIYILTNGIGLKLK
jgi:hypothetical protein